ncbi:MAG: hypothetical protein K2X86_05395 [Cytophagaceae bacterium]|nr:hypothetical protein [Cytophagaceae bacterium]
MSIAFRILLICGSLFLTGCLEIIEEVNLNPNRSGTLTLTINASQSKSNLDKIMGQDSIYGQKVPKRQDIEKALADVSNKLKNTKGISEVEISRDFNDYILVIKCSFANVAALNAAINNIWLLYDKKAPVNRLHFSYEQNTFKRSFDYGLIKNVKDKLGSQEKDILSKSYYTTLYKFQSEIISNTNSSATLSKSKKAIILKNSVLDIVNGKKNIQNQIKLK